MLVKHWNCYRGRYTIIRPLQTGKNGMRKVEKDMEKGREYHPYEQGVLPLDRGLDGIRKELNARGINISAHYIKRFLMASDGFKKYTSGEREIDPQGAPDYDDSEGRENEKRYNKRVPYEVEPLIDAYLIAKYREEIEKGNFQESYFEELKKVESSYFCCKRDNDSSYQIIKADDLCLRHLIERVVTILMISRIGEPVERPTLMLEFLTELEFLISELTHKYLNASDWRKQISSLEQKQSRLTFATLHENLPVKSVREEEKFNASSELYDKLHKLNNRRENGTYPGKLKAARIEYEKWLEGLLSEKEKKISMDFETSIHKVDSYLKSSKSNSLEKTKKKIRGSLRTFVKAMILRSDTTEIEYKILDLPNDDILLINSVKKKQLELVKYAFPHMRYWSASIVLSTVLAQGIKSKGEEVIGRIWMHSKELCKELSIAISALSGDSAYLNKTLKLDKSILKAKVFPHQLTEQNKRKDQKLEIILKNTHVEANRLKTFTEGRMVTRIELSNINSLCIVYRWLVEAALFQKIETSVEDISNELLKRKNLDIKIKEEEYAKILEEVIYKYMICSEN